MLKPLIAATAIFAIAGSTIVYAQQRSDGHHGFGSGPRAEHRHRSPEDIAAYTDARIAALKAGLELTPDQARNWPAFEQALRDMATLRAQRRQARQAAAGQPQQSPATPFDRLGRRADTMSKFSAALKKVADAGAPLYMSLNDDQKGRFTTLARSLRGHHRHGGHDGNWREGWRGQGHGHHGWQGRQFGQNDGQNGQSEDGYRHDGHGQGHWGDHGRDGRHGTMNRSSDENSTDL
jgi:hypothetical protein